MNMNILAKASAVALGLAAVSPAQAVTFLYYPGDSAPSAGFTVINQFDDTTGISGSNFQINTPPADSTGAPPAYATFGSSSYLSVLTGGSATISFAGATAVEFDWGSIDDYNTLTVLLNGGAEYVITPGGNFTNDANGDQILPSTNGLFQIFADEGETIYGLRLESSKNSFEIDNLAMAPVPEPATWAMMIAGLGLVGGMMRRRAGAARVTFA
jgi:PEP-CTERM putative exosortase interaction domain